MKRGGAGVQGSRGELSPLPPCSPAPLLLDNKLAEDPCHYQPPSTAAPPPPARATNGATGRATCRRASTRCPTTGSITPFAIARR
ncbi:protein of unknown function [Candidatus Promineifilum breve]|uniref:Uncharacterized protein n=1 Tax=Candidatus Promineifilum breve TaxID=1806508 RepID=A0A160T6L5_9CHLR|nr:protein of unknown function [Candidatus Promineifilum breve]